jgi:hypothetical protein
MTKDPLVDLVVLRVDDVVEAPTKFMHLDRMEATVTNAASVCGLVVTTSALDGNVAATNKDGSDWQSNSSISNPMELVPAPCWNVDHVALSPCLNTDQELSQLEPDLVTGFVAHVSKPLQMVVARKPPIRRRVRNMLPTTEDNLPRWSACVAAQGRGHVSNLEMQAQNVLMKKWQITLEARSPDADALQDYNTMYRSPSGSSHWRAIRALYTTKDLLPSVESVDVGP